MKLLTRWIPDTRGMTLVEVLVGISLLVIVSTATVSGLFHATSTQGTVMDDGIAIHGLRNGLGWIAQDVRKAQEMDLEDGAPAAQSMTLSWTNHYQDEDTEHTVVYDVQGDRLVRTLDGASHTVVRGVVSASFTLSGSTVHAEVTVDAGRDTTRVLSLRAVRRST